MARIAASGLLATLGLSVGLLAQNAPAAAQAAGCGDIQKILQERQAIVGQLNASAKTKQKLTPQAACSTLGRLVSNGNTALKFASANMDWCQIPASFVDGLKADNERAGKIRNQACNAVKQQAAMQKKAQQQAQQGGGANPFGGSDSITGGSIRVPQGAL